MATSLPNNRAITNTRAEHVADHNLIATLFGKISDVTLFGAVGDGVADDTSAIDDAITDAGAGGIVFFPSGTYLITSTLIIKTHVMSSPDAIINYTGTGVAVQIGEVASAIDDVVAQLPRIQRPTNRWHTPSLAIASDTGLRIINCKNCIIEFIRILDYSIGVECFGSDNGFADNVVRGQRILNCAIGLKLDRFGSGWVSEAVYDIKKITVGDGILSGRVVGTRGVQKLTPNSNNVFRNINFEGNRLEYAIEVHGNGGVFSNCRFESADNDLDPNKFFIGDDATGWLFDNGPHLDDVEIDLEAGYTGTHNQRRYINTTTGATVEDAF